MNKDSINLPAIPLRGITIFPNMIIHFDVGREKSISALEESMLKDSKIFLVSQIDPEIEDPKRNEIYSIGTICKIKQILKPIFFLYDSFFYRSFYYVVRKQHHHDTIEQRE